MAIKDSPFGKDIYSNEIKKDLRTFYDSITQQLNSTAFANYARFLNYGYLPNDNPQHAVIDLPKYALNRNHIKLILETIGICDLTNRRVLDVGCGRGGTVSVIADYFQAQQIVGMDLSSSAVAFCHRNYNYPHTRFVEGDAEHLPFRRHSFEVITNIESSHCYPNIFSFYREIKRVLIPGGYFLYTDLLPTNKLAENLSFLLELGFTIKHERDITSNVLLSCDDIARKNKAAFQEDNEANIMNNFLAVPGSDVYENMKSGHSKYMLFRLKRSHKM